MRQATVRSAFQGVIRVPLITLLSHFAVDDAVPAKINTRELAGIAAVIFLRIPVITLLGFFAIAVTAQRHCKRSSFALAGSIAAVTILGIPVIALLAMISLHATIAAFLDATECAAGVIDIVRPAVTFFVVQRIDDPVTAPRHPAVRPADIGERVTVRPSFITLLITGARKKCFRSIIDLSIPIIIDALDAGKIIRTICIHFSVAAELQQTGGTAPIKRCRVPVIAFLPALLASVAAENELTLVIADIAGFLCADGKHLYAGPPIPAVLIRLTGSSAGIADERDFRTIRIVLRLA